MNPRTVLCLLAVANAWLQLDENSYSQELPTGSAGSYFLAPITTEVHRLRVSSTASAYGRVDAASLIADGAITLIPLNLVQFEADLRALSARDPKKLHLELFYGEIKSQLDNKLNNELISRLRVIAKRAGFTDVRLVTTQSSAKWENRYGSTTTEARSDFDEPVLKNQWITAHPIRTPLSKIEVGDADCVIEIRQPFDGRQTGLSPELTSAIKNAVAQMNLSQPRSKLLFYVSSTTAGVELMETIFSTRKPRPIPAEIKSPELRQLLQREADAIKLSPAMVLAQELGFETFTYRHSPNGGAPQELLGQPAPDFEHTALDGKILNFTSFRNGRPALISFWGVACAPCVKEAPYLTQAHKTLGDRIAVVAVNSYDEELEHVRRFAIENHFEHPIVVQGAATAQKYRVSAYPTTFCVDSQGVVIDYFVGFDFPEDIDRPLAKLLKN